MKISRYDKKNKYAILAFNWCIDNFGVCNRKKRKLIFEFTKKKGLLDYKYPICGRYCFYRNKIIIYEPTCHTLYDVVSTVIHEYTHYLQSGYRYKKYEKKYFYSQNPLERQAKKFEKLYTNQCIQSIKKLLNNI